MCTAGQEAGVLGLPGCAGEPMAPGGMCGGSTGKCALLAACLWVRWGAMEGWAAWLGSVGTQRFCL